jgi:hypothetical protein
MLEKIGVTWRNAHCKQQKCIFMQIVLQVPNPDTQQILGDQMKSMVKRKLQALYDVNVFHQQNNYRLDSQYMKQSESHIKLQNTTISPTCKSSRCEIESITKLQNLPTNRQTMQSVSTVS